MKRTAIQPWKRGQPITARRLDEPRRAIEQLMAQGIGPRQVLLPGVAHRVAQMTITAIGGDTLTCGDVTVSKPPLLRNSVSSRDGIDFTYTGTDQRTADDGATTEDQVVVPGYLVGDTIYAVSVPRGADGISWLDLNVDARAWAKSA